MTKPEKVDHFYGERSNRTHLRKSKAGCRNLQFSVCLIEKAFILYSDTSKLATGSVLYQFQDGKPRLIAYMSKRMPEAAKNYSITELEMCGLVINIATFFTFTKKGRF